MAYCVYKHTFPNGKVYIGITSMKPEYRWGHCGKGYLHKVGDKYQQPIMANAILKYGWKDIDHEILYENLTKEEAEEKEIELIKKYQSNKKAFGYNIANGGNTIGTHSDQTKKKMSESKKKMSEDTREKIRLSKTGSNNYWYGKKLSKEHKSKIGLSNKGKTYSDEQRKKRSEIRSGIPLSNSHKENIRLNSKSSVVHCIETNLTYNSLREAERKTGIDNRSISKACKGKLKTAGGYHWKFVNEYVKKTSNKCVSVRCIETKECYKSLTDAERKTKISRKIISNACHGKYETAGGYHWEFVNNYNCCDENNQKIIRCVETDVIYNSMSEAMKQTGISVSGISKCCCGKQKTAGGFHWEFVNKDTQ